MQIHPLGDQALLAYCPDESAAARLASAIRKLQPVWLIDVVPAYASVAVFFELGQTNYTNVVSWVQQLDVPHEKATAGKLVEVPCCYDLGPDMPQVAEHLGLLPVEVVRLHTCTAYTVFAIGFSPGFPYLGYLPAELCGVPRLASPRLRVEPGSVGLTGRQTAIYPSATPGGWPIIGRTPMVLVDLDREYLALAAGDWVQFRAIPASEFERMPASVRNS